MIGSTCFNEAGGFLPRKPTSECSQHQTQSASMRPGDFSPGNTHPTMPLPAPATPASMRPGDFSPGNLSQSSVDSPAPHLCFNEAGGFLPRKHIGRRLRELADRHASMRPGDFSPGNVIRRPRSPWAAATGFNEAGGFLPRKLRLLSGVVCGEETVLQ